MQKERELVVHNYYELGLGEPIIISTLHGVGIGDLLDAIVQQLQVVTEHEKKMMLLSLALLVSQTLVNHHS